MLILPISSPNKCPFFAKIQTFFENFNVKSDWTKPLRGSLCLRFVSNSYVMTLSVVLNMFCLMLLLKYPDGGYTE